MRKILLTSILLLSLIGTTVAADIDPIAQAKALLDQYSARVKVLEAENAILREEMRKANIQIPLSLYSGAIQVVLPPTDSIGGKVPTAATGSSTATGVITNIPTDADTEAMIATIQTTYGADQAGFVRRVISEWDKIKSAYELPAEARIGGYEFVQSGDLDHVFLDISFSDAATGNNGIFDAKILYQFEKKTFGRKLIGFFEYNKASGYYITKSGKNIFPGVKRIFILDTRGGTTPTTTVTPPPTSSTTPSSSVTPTKTGSTVTFAEIESAYADKRFLSVVTLSNTWLEANGPSLDILRIRYRTFFIIAKYSDALKEIEKIRSLGQLTSAVACEGYVIATYAKDNALSENYKAICNKK